MAVNPCPCMTLRKGSMALAMLDAVFAMVNLGLLILSLVLYIRYESKENSELTKSERTVGIVVVIILIIMCLLQIHLASRLYYGARSKDYRNCRLWLIITIISTVINSANLILNFTISDLNLTSFSGTLINILYKLYEMLVVFFFLKEMKRELCGLDVRYTVTAPQQPAPVYATPQSVEVYPMQEYQPNYNQTPAVINSQSYYPASVHHVTTS